MLPNRHTTCSFLGVINGRLPSNVWDVDRLEFMGIAAVRLAGCKQGLAMYVALLLFAMAFLPSKCLASQVEVDLVSNDVVTVNGASFEWVSSTAGTNGLFHAFLTVKGNGTVGAYNSGGSHKIQLRGVPHVTIDGADYLQFALKIQGKEVSLDDIEIFTSPAPNLKTTDLSQLGVKRWDLAKSCWNYDDQGGSLCPPVWDEVVVQIDPHRRQKRSVADLFLYIPSGNFAAAAPTDYVYFFCVFGDPQSPLESAITRHPMNGATAKWGAFVPR